MERKSVIEYLKKGVAILGAVGMVASGAGILYGTTEFMNGYAESVNLENDKVAFVANYERVTDNTNLDGRIEMLSLNANQDELNTIEDFELREAKAEEKSQNGLDIAKNGIIGGAIFGMVGLASAGYFDPVKDKLKEVFSKDDEHSI